MCGISFHCIWLPEFSWTNLNYHCKSLQVKLLTRTCSAWVYDAAVCNPTYSKTSVLAILTLLQNRQVYRVYLSICVLVLVLTSEVDYRGKVGLRFDIGQTLRNFKLLLLGNDLSYIPQFRLFMKENMCTTLHRFYFPESDQSFIITRQPCRQPAQSQCN